MPGGLSQSDHGSPARVADGGGCRFVHTLRRCDEDGCMELVRARTTWKPDPSKTEASGTPAALQ